MKGLPFSLGYGICWLVWIVLHALILSRLGYTWKVAAMDSTVNNVLLALSGFILSTNLRYYRPDKSVSVYVIAIGLGFVSVLVAKWVLTQLIVNDPAYLLFLNQSLPVRFCIAFLLTGCVTMLSWIWYTLEEQKENEKRRTLTEQLSREAELYNLRQQIKPHFLFNSLNSISALAGSNPEEARKMIQTLSDFLRGTLNKEEQNQLSLKEEAQHLQLYLDIEKVRFGHRLKTEIKCDESCLEMKLPQLILQPIVENAIKFGLYDTTDVVRITIRAESLDGQLQITVQNPFDPSTSKSGNGTGFGLRSIQRRLYLLFARNDLLETKEDGSVFTTIVKIPQQHG